MKTLDQYAIFCTEAQIKKALKLGAELNLDYHSDDFPHTVKIANKLYAEIPTAEQMIGWLEECEEIDEITPFKMEEYWVYIVYMTGWLSDIKNPEGTFYPSRREATLAAIDAALDYLSKNKK